MPAIGVPASVFHVNARASCVGLPQRDCARWKTHPDSAGPESDHRDGSPLPESAVTSGALNQEHARCTRSVKMTYLVQVPGRDYNALMDVAAEQYGYVTAADAAAVGV